jgi:dolichol-phosphate mannosyltransferase
MMKLPMQTMSERQVEPILSTVTIVMDEEARAIHAAPASRRTARFHIPRTFDLIRLRWRTQFLGYPEILRRRTSLLYAVLLAAIGAVLLFTDINHPLLDPVEGRHAEIPREMLVRHDFLVPHLGGNAYFEKPPLQYWLTAGAYRLCGLHSWVARLVPACAALLTVMIVYAWGSRSIGTRPAFFGALILCLMPGYVLAGRTVILDSLLTACVTSSWFAAHRAIERGPLCYRWWITSAVLCGLGVLAKGPVAVVLLVPPVLAYEFLAPQSSRPGLRGWAVYLLCAGLVAAPWYVLMVWRETDFLKEFVWKAHVLRFFSPYTHEQPWWFYFPVLLGFTFPWCFLLPALGIFIWTRNDQVAYLRPTGLGFCVLALVWCVLFYGLAGCKSPFYLLPALVPLALMLGACVEGLLSRELQIGSRIWNHARKLRPREGALILLVLSACGYPASAILGFQGWAAALGQCLGAVLAAVLWWRLGKRASATVSWGVCAVSAIAFNLTLLQDVVVGVAEQRTPALVARTLERLPQSGNRTVIGYGSVLPSAWFYLQSEHIPFIPTEAVTSLFDVAEKGSELVVLLREDEDLEGVVRKAPPDLEMQVYRPEGMSRMALLVMHQRPRTMTNDEARMTKE